jgi:hypothetical protein
MRIRVLTALGVLLVAASTIQTATAAARAPVQVTRQLRDAFGSVDRPSAAQSDYSHDSQRHGLSAPAAVDTRSCDVIWCYQD